MMRRRWSSRATICAIAVLVASPWAAAQTVIGKVELSGRPAVLFEDGTWRFSGSTPVCASVGGVATVCTNPIDWHRVPNSAWLAPQALSLRHDQQTMASVTAGPGIDWLAGISETEFAHMVESDDPIATYGPLVSLYQQTRRSSAGLLPTIIGRDVSIVDGRPALTVVWSGEGIEYLTLLFDEDVFVMASVTSTGTIKTDALNRVTASLLAAIDLPGGA